AFEPPSDPFGPGHRGIDVSGSTGQRVLAIGNGRVTFAGSIASRGVVVVRHGALRSTYEPVTALVRRGDTVTAGQPIGLLQVTGSHCRPTACLHLGVRDGDEYVDPMDLFGHRPVHLKPLAKPSASAPDSSAVAADGGAGLTPIERSVTPARDGA